MASLAAQFNSLDDASKDYFNEVQEEAFSKQAVAFLDAYWEEVGGQAPFIFECAYEVMKEIDMQQNGIIYMHLYEESPALKDFDWALLFFEKLCKAVETRETEDRDNAGEIVMNNGAPVMKKWCDIPYYSMSMPTMMTAVTRKNEIRDKVDFNNDGTISFLEYLIYTYKRISNATDFILKGRALRDGKGGANGPEAEQLMLAQLALDEVKRKIAEYQAAMAKQQAIIDDFENGVLNEDGTQKVGRAKAGRATFELKQLQGSNLASELKQALIEAEFKVKQAMKIIRENLAKKSGKEKQKAKSPGGMFWVEATLASQQKRAKGFGLKGLVSKG